MAVWAYVCRSCEDDPPQTWYASAVQVAEMATDTRIIRVNVGSEWRCAIVDRDRQVAVEQMLVREAVASTEDDCPACRERLAERARFARDAVEASERQSPEREVGPERAPSAKLPASSGSVQAAAIALGGTRLVVVVVSMALVRSAGEADMAVDTLAPSFGGVPVVLMAQEEDGSPRYYGDADLVRLLRGIPLERMPWKEYPVA